MHCVAVDLFCGIGGLTNGLIKAGVDVVAGIDFEKSCKFAYETNNHAAFIQRDITTLTSQELQNLYPANNNLVHVLAGCAPCQPFSKYSQRYRKEGYKDDKWRLLYYFGELAKETLPEIIAMENVPELSNTGVFSDFVAELRQCGYSVYSGIVFCPDYGVPQLRKRVVLLASLLGDIELIPPTHTKETYLTVRDAIEDLPPISAGEVDKNDPIHSATALNAVNIERIQQSKPGGTWRDWDERLQLKCHKKETGKTYPSVYGRMSWDEPSPTITSQFYGYGNGRFGHPEQDRAISMREGALLQSFPRDYIFADELHPLSRKQLGLQIGNAVPVKLGFAIGQSIIEHVRRYEHGD